MELTPAQSSVLQKPFQQKLFLSGPAGSGKTTTAVARLLDLIRDGVSGQNILILVPQRTLAGPYREALRGIDGGLADILTTGGLARRMIDLFWPLVAAKAGFAHPDQPPGFLTLETAQYYMAHLVRPLLDQGFFESITIDRNRLYSQILDNLNKAALVGFPHAGISQRLKDAWSGDSSQLRVYDDTQRCAELFRNFCLENNLLDFSLQVELFKNQLWPSLLCRAYLKSTYHHLIADNLEEDTPFTHDLLAVWLPDLDSALLVFDQNAGYRSFLSADRQSALNLIHHCDEHLSFTGSLICPPEMERLGQSIGLALERPDALPVEDTSLPEALSISPQIRFYPQMLDWAAEEVLGLIQNGTPPGEIAVLAPLLPDSLRFSLSERFDRLGIPYRSHRPSRALADEPPARCLLTFAQLAHPDWEMKPSKFEVAYALLQAIDGLDLVRAQLIAEIAYRTRDGKPVLEPLDRLRPEMQERITFTLGTRYDELRGWLKRSIEQPALELDYFLSRLFGEVLSQPGFGFHTNLDAGQTAATLIESAQKFRRAVELHGTTSDAPLGKEYFEMVRDGVIAAQYIESWQAGAADAVFLAPAYTFLLNNRPVDHQFWLDGGSNAWFERLYQPLTHPYVLSRSWKPGRLWTAEDEYETNREMLYRLAMGLLRRCRRQVHLGFSDLSESGYEQRGMLLKVIHMVQMMDRGGWNG